MNENAMKNTLKLLAVTAILLLSWAFTKPKTLPEVGEKAPEIALAAPDGTIIKLSSLKGKVVLIDFWASWCGPCRKANPGVVKVYNKYKDQGFTVYSVSLDQNKQRWEQAIEKDGLAWKNHVSDLKFWNNKAAADYGVEGIPATFLLDKNGVIIDSDLHGNSLDGAVKRALKK